jgi:hypothetical protein
MNSELRLREYLSGAALLASGIRLARIEGPSGIKDRCTMVFHNENGQAEKALADHERGVLAVSSLEYALAVQSLKSRLFMARREG